MFEGLLFMHGYAVCVIAYFIIYLSSFVTYCCFSGFQWDGEFWNQTHICFASWSDRISKATFKDRQFLRGDKKSFGREWY